MQHFLKPAPGTAWAQIVPPKLLHKQLVATHNAAPALDASLAEGTPDDACLTAQKQESDSKSFVCLAIRPPGWRWEEQSNDLWQTAAA
jgi:hypothetical protein